MDLAAVKLHLLAQGALSFMEHMWRFLDLQHLIHYDDASLFSRKVWIRRLEQAGPETAMDCVRFHCGFPFTIGEMEEDHMHELENKAITELLVELPGWIICLPRVAQEGQTSSCPVLVKEAVL